MRGSSLARECAVFCRYLVAAPPSRYVVERYAEAHRARPELVQATRFDGACLDLAVKGVPAARIGDAYARLFAPRGLLRRKLTLLLAILESSPDLHRRIEAVDTARRPLLVLRLAGQLVLWLAAVAAGLIVLGPAQLLARGRPAGAGGSG